MRNLLHTCNSFAPHSKLHLLAQIIIPVIPAPAPTSMQACGPDGLFRFQVSKTDIIENDTVRITLLAMAYYGGTISIDGTGIIVEHDVADTQVEVLPDTVMPTITCSGSLTIEGCDESAFDISCAIIVQELFDDATIVQTFVKLVQVFCIY